MEGYVSSIEKSRNAPPFSTSTEIPNALDGYEGGNMIHGVDSFRADNLLWRVSYFETSLGENGVGGRAGRPRVISWVAFPGQCKASKG
jgi:hypothetical protein